MAKKFFSVFAAFALLFTSCEMLTGEQTGKFHITSETTVVIPAAGMCNTSVYVIDEAVNGAKVTATADVDWIDDIAVNEEACTIKFCVKANTGEARTGKIVAAYANAKAEITIEQEAAAASKIELTSPATLDAPADGYCYTSYYVINEVVEGATVSATADVEWIEEVTVDEGTCGIRFCVKPNEGDARTGAVNISYDDETVTVTVNQEAALAE